MSRKTRRKLFSNFMLFLSFLTAAYGIFWLFWILGSLFINGFKYLSPSLSIWTLHHPERRGEV
jgi:phosphate transport system permease protein